MSTSRKWFLASFVANGFGGAGIIALAHQAGYGFLGAILWLAGIVAAYTFGDYANDMAKDAESGQGKRAADSQ